MYDNIQLTSLERQKKLYNSGPGKSVIQTYVDSIANGLSKEEVIEKMAESVSKEMKGNPLAFVHVAETNVLQAVDISYGRVVGDRAALINEFKKDKENVRNVFTPPNDPAIHVEIWQSK